MNIFQHTDNIAIELSNDCNLKHIHKECPLFLEKDKPVITLDSKIIYYVLDTLKKYSYNKSLQFNSYNEPLVDDRLIEFIKYANKQCGINDIIMTTNGIYLNQQKLDELIEAGIKLIRITIYFHETREKIKSLKSSIPLLYNSESIDGLDGRLEIYTRNDYYNFRSCSAPLGQIIIRKTGDIVLCCADWNDTCLFGNLYKQTLEEILTSEKVKTIYTNLKNNNHDILEICKRCPGGR